MKILITGGAGYIGSILCQQLLDDGHEVVCWDNLMYGQNPSGHVMGHPNFTFVKRSVSDIHLSSDLTNADVIIPLAAIVGAPACIRNYELAKVTNEHMIKELISICRDQLILFPTTNSGYGTQTGEEYCTEETPLHPISHYGRLKAAAEEAVLAYHKGISLRLATVFGTSPRMRMDLMVNDFVWQATKGNIVLFEPHFKRNFVHIRDVARCFSFFIKGFSEWKGSFSYITGKSLFFSNAGNRIFNLGNDLANMTKLQLAETIQRVYPYFEILISTKGSDPDKRNYVVSNEKLRKYGFEAEFGLEYGIKELISYYSALPKFRLGNI